SNGPVTFGYGLKSRVVFQSQFKSGMDEATIRMENPPIARKFFLRAVRFVHFANRWLNTMDCFPSSFDGLPRGMIFGNACPIVSAERHGGQSGSVVESGRRIGLPGVTRRFRVRHFRG